MTIRRRGDPMTRLTDALVNRLIDKIANGDLDHMIDIGAKPKNQRFTIGTGDSQADASDAPEKKKE